MSKVWNSRNPEHHSILIERNLATEIWTQTSLRFQILFSKEKSNCDWWSVASFLTINKVKLLLITSRISPFRFLCLPLNVPVTILSSISAGPTPFTGVCMSALQYFSQYTQNLETTTVGSRHNEELGVHYTRRIEVQLTYKHTNWTADVRAGDYQIKKKSS